MIQTLVLENVKHRPLRTALSVLLIALPVTLILTLVGLSHGYIQDSSRRTKGIGADIMIRPQGSAMMQFSGSTLPQGLVDLIAKQPHVSIAMGTIGHAFGGWNQVSGIDPVLFNRMNGGFTFVQGHGLEKPDDVLLDTYFANQEHKKVGESITLINRPWHIAGIVEPGKLSHIFVEGPVLQELDASQRKWSLIYIKVDDAKNLNSVVDTLKRLLPGYPVLRLEDYLSQISVDNIPYLKAFINVIVGVGILIAFAVVFLSMYTAILQRTREIGILKSLGASQWFVLEIILIESVMMAIAGTIVGIACSYLTRFAINRFVPASLPQAIVPEWWPIAGAVVVGAAIIGSLYPGMIAVRQDPIEALAYE